MDWNSSFTYNMDQKKNSRMEHFVSVLAGNGDNDLKAEIWKCEH